MMLLLLLKHQQSHSQLYVAATNNVTQPKLIRKPLMVGCHHSPIASNGSSKKLSAAKPLFGKAVFCVDNVNLDVIGDELEVYVKSLSVRVVSCHQVNPRRTYKQKRDNIYPNDHKTFRLCIYKADSNLLLNSDVWPDDIAISVYYFKPNKTDKLPEMQTIEQTAAAAAESERATGSARSNDTTGDEHFDEAMSLSPITPTAAEASANDTESTILCDQVDTPTNQDGC